MSNGLKSIRFAWWNTGFAPPWVAAKDQTHRAAAVTVVADLIGREGCGLVALAEVRRQNVLAWIPSKARPRWKVVRDTSEDRNDFDVAIAYDTSLLTLESKGWIRAMFAGSPVRAGLLARFRSDADASVLLVVAAHWRSDSANTVDADARRTCAADAVRSAISHEQRRQGDPTHLMVLGDFNVEPFGLPFASSLPTARSRDVVMHHRTRNSGDVLLYNASWRWLGERQLWRSDQPSNSLAGTYRARNNRPSAWRTWDQVMVSGSLLAGSGWSLREDALGIWSDERVFDAATSSPRPPFDHLPLVGYLEWVPPLNV